MKLDLHTIYTFGVAGNFTGHLEQAGEALSFKDVAVKGALAPKALFPTYIPPTSLAAAKVCNSTIPSFLHVFPFDEDIIKFPFGEQKLQIESECAVVFDAHWQGEYVDSLTPVCFAASNDCSIRKEGVCKISVKKNWGAASKGVASSFMIPLTKFSKGCILDRYRIASFLIRDKDIASYGENSLVSDYNYIYESLTSWIIEKLNEQKDSGPTEDIHSYLLYSGKPTRLLFSIGATRYTNYGEHIFLKGGDSAVVVLYPEDRYSLSQITEMATLGKLQQEDISALVQKVVVEQAEVSNAL